MAHLEFGIIRWALLKWPAPSEFICWGKRSLFSMDQMQTGRVRMRAGAGSSQMSPRGLEGRGDPTWK